MGGQAFAPSFIFVPVLSRLYLRKRNSPEPFFLFIVKDREKILLIN
jgi:hypothetical protein